MAPKRDGEGLHVVNVSDDGVQGTPCKEKSRPVIVERATAANLSAFASSRIRQGLVPGSGNPLPRLS